MGRWFIPKGGAREKVCDMMLLILVGGGGAREVKYFDWIRVKK